MQTVFIDIEETCISYLFNNIKLMNYTKMYFMKPYMLKASTISD